MSLVAARVAVFGRASETFLCPSQRFCLSGDPGQAESQTFMWGHSHAVLYALEKVISK